MFNESSLVYHTVQVLNAINIALSGRQQQFLLPFGFVWKYGILWYISNEIAI